MATYFISDPEGHDILAHRTLGPDDRLYILGDLTDSTAATAFENLPGFLQRKSFNLRNIMHVVNDERVHLVLGNRDLNKIRCVALNKLNPDVGRLVAEFNHGRVQLSHARYAELKDHVCEWMVRHNRSPWQACMSNWYPFWNPRTQAAHWAAKRHPSSHSRSYPFLARFADVFGLDDGTVGTMSAQNLLYTIPFEIGIDVQLPAKNEMEKGVDAQYGVRNETLDYYAFIVLAVYNSMLEPIRTRSSHRYALPVAGRTLTAEFCRGALYSMLTSRRSAVCRVFDLPASNQIILCSHGGFTSNMLNQSGPVSIETIWDAITRSFDKKDLMYNILTDARRFTGGYYSTPSDKPTYTVGEITRRVTQINRIFSECIRHSFASSAPTDGLPTPHMLFLQVMSTPFDCRALQVAAPTLDCSQHMASTSISPIQPGYRHARVHHFFVHDRSLFNLFGHLPVGYATTIDLFENKKAQCFLVNLDSSNSFKTSGEDQGASYSHVSWRHSDDEIYVESIIEMNDRGYAIPLADVALLQGSFPIASEAQKSANKAFHARLGMVVDDTLVERIRMCGTNPLVHFHGYVRDTNILTFRESDASFNKVLVKVPARATSPTGTRGLQLGLQLGRKRGSKSPIRRGARRQPNR